MGSLRALLFGLYVTNDQHHYSVSLSQEEGERQLYSLTETSSVEEGWYFVEFENGRTRWYETGIYQSRNSVQFDNKIRERLLRKKGIKKIVGYHIHPTGSRDIIFGPSIADLIGSFNRYFFPVEFETRIVESNGIYSIIGSLSEEVLFEVYLEGLPWSILETPYTTPEEYACGISTENMKVEFIPRSDSD